MKKPAFAGFFLSLYTSLLQHFLDILLKVFLLTFARQSLEIINLFHHPIFFVRTSGCKDNENNLYRKRLT